MAMLNFPSPLPRSIKQCRTNPAAPTTGDPVTSQMPPEWIPQWVPTYSAARPQQTFRATRPRIPQYHHSQEALPNHILPPKTTPLPPPPPPTRSFPAPAGQSFLRTIHGKKTSSVLALGLELPML